VLCIEINAQQKGVLQMELAKITMRGQITIPIEIRKRLGVRDGDKVIFLEENGRVIMENASMIALKNAQTAFAGEAERLGLQTEQDVVDLVKEVRREVWEEKHARND
jgi:AbrB family looped-hinge helix DNA binding protein